MVGSLGIDPQRRWLVQAFGDPIVSDRVAQMTFKLIVEARLEQLSSQIAAPNISTPSFY